VSEPRATWDEATLDLALVEATSGLRPDERAALLARVDPRDFEELELTLAELSLGGLRELEAPPVALLARVRADARLHVRADALAQPQAAPRARPLPLPWKAYAGWLIAAGVLAFFALRGSTVRAPSAAERRGQLLATATDVLTAEWKPGPDPLAGAVGGDVVWSRARQQGYMRLCALPPNDPRQQQYQLWIFDKTRAEWEAQPVDGGVFDVAPGQEVIVPIAPKLEVREPALFAITLEVQGGVVVSKREHLLALATP
jgi:hypothetical protein